MREDILKPNFGLGVLAGDRMGPQGWRGGTFCARFRRGRVSNGFDAMDPIVWCGRVNMRRGGLSEEGCEYCEVVGGGYWGQ